MKKFLLCGLVFSSVLMGESDATSTSTNDGIVKVEEGANMTPLPTDNKVWTTAPLDTTPIKFNMFATGECKVENKDLIITGSMEVPDFFDSDGEKFIFKKPAPMATIQVPDGFTTYLTITLEGVTNKTGFNDNIQNYVALGVHEQTAEEGTYATILNVNSKASECFHVDSKNTLELVPLISSEDMSSGEYTAVTAGEAITTCPALSGYADTSFDFGALFGVSVECANEEPEKKTTWKKQNWTGEHGDTIFYANGVFFGYNNSNSNLYYLDNDAWIKTQGQFSSRVIGVFYYDQSEEYLAITSESQLFVSKNKDSWSPYSVTGTPVDNTISSGVKLGDKIIVVSREGGAFCSMGVLSYEDKSWIPGAEVDIGYGDTNEARGICYGDGVLMVASNCGPWGISDNDGASWTAVGNILQSDYVCGLEFGKEGFLSLDTAGNLKINTDKKSWQDFGNISSEWIEVSENGFNGGVCLHSLVNDGDAFYAMDGNGNVYRSPAVPYIDLIKKS